MKKGLKIFDSFILNMDKIVIFEINEEALIINLNSIAIPSPDYVHISFKEGHDIGKKRDNFELDGIIYVEIQELHRIKREICEYFGVDEPLLTVD